MPHRRLSGSGAQGNRCTNLLRECVIIYSVLLMVFVLLKGASSSACEAQRRNPADRSWLYASAPSFMNFIAALVVPQIIIFIILLFLDWKTTLILYGTVCILKVFGILRLVRVAEYILVVPLAKVLLKDAK